MIDDAVDVNSFGDDHFYRCLDKDDFEGFMKLREGGYRMKKLRADFLYRAIAKDNLNFFKYVFELKPQRFGKNQFLLHFCIKSKALKIFEYLLGKNCFDWSKIYWGSKKYDWLELVAATGFVESLPLINSRSFVDKYRLQSCLWKFLPFVENQKTFEELIQDFHVQLLKSVNKRQQTTQDFDEFLHWFANHPKFLQNDRNRSVLIFLMDNYFDHPLLQNDSMVPNSSTQVLRYLRHFYNQDDWVLFDDLCRKDSVVNMFSNNPRAYNSDDFKRLISDSVLQDKLEFQRSLMLIHRNVITVYCNVVSSLNPSQFGLNIMKSLQMCANCFSDKYWNELSFRYKMTAIWLKFGIKITLFFFGLF